MTNLYTLTKNPKKKTTVRLVGMAAAVIGARKKPLVPRPPHHPPPAHLSSPASLSTWSPPPDRERPRSRSRSRPRSPKTLRSRQGTERKVTRASLRKSAEFTGLELGRILFTIEPNLNEDELRDVVEILLPVIERSIYD